MKRLALVALCGCLLSCSKNDSKNNEVSIIGKWQMEKSTYIEIEYNNGVEITRDTAVFTKDGSYVDFLATKKAVAYDHDHDSYDTSNYSISGNTLMLDDVKATIMEHTNNSLKFNYKTVSNYGSTSQTTFGFLELSK